MNASSPNESAPPFPEKRLKILQLEDNPTDALLVREMLDADQVLGLDLHRARDAPPAGAGGCSACAATPVVWAAQRRSTAVICSSRTGLIITSFMPASSAA